MRGPLINRRSILSGAGALAGAAFLPGRAAAAPAELAPVKLPPPISREERLARISRARELMRRNGIGSVLVVRDGQIPPVPLLNLRDAQPQRPAAPARAKEEATP